MVTMVCVCVANITPVRVAAEVNVRGGERVAVTGAVRQADKRGRGNMHGELEEMKVEWRRGEKRYE